jgi:hypothetical protein
VRGCTSSRGGFLILGGGSFTLERRTLELRGCKGEGGCTTCGVLLRRGCT